MLTKPIKLTKGGIYLYKFVRTTSFRHCSLVLWLLLLRISKNLQIFKKNFFNVGCDPYLVFLALKFLPTIFCI